jgi:hypothetical protein
MHKYSSLAQRVVLASLTQTGNFDWTLGMANLDDAEKQKRRANLEKFFALSADEIAMLEVECRLDDRTVNAFNVYAQWSRQKSIK